MNTAQAALAQLDQLVAGLKTTKEKSKASITSAGFDTDFNTPLTDGLIDVARGFLEHNDIKSATAAMTRAIAAAELECDLLELQANLHFLRNPE